METKSNTIPTITTTSPSQNKAFIESPQSNAQSRISIIHEPRHLVRKSRAVQRPFQRIEGRISLSAKCRSRPRTPMTDSKDFSLSRRQWLGLAATASVGSGLMGLTTMMGQASPSAASHDLGTRTYNIRDFGAKGDGVTLDTAALQAAIDACNRDQGGTVLVPAGRFVIGTVELKSNIILHIAPQGVLLGSADGRQYHAADAIPLTGDSTLADGNVGLLYAVGAENITIEGQGTIDGQGSQFRSPSKEVPPPAGITGSHRPYHLLFY